MTRRRADTAADVSAGVVSRLAAFAIDAAAVTLGLTLLFWTIGAMSMVVHLGLGKRQWEGTFVGVIVTVGFIVAYYAGSWAAWGATLGKAIMGLRVRGPGGGPPTLGRALLRLLGYVLSGLPFGAGFAWALVDPERKTWHDLLASTRVVYVTPEIPRARLPAPRRRSSYGA